MLVFGCVLAVAGIVALGFGPILIQGSWQLRFPTLAIGANLASLFIGMALIFAAVVVALMVSTQGLTANIHPTVLSALIAFLSFCLAAALAGFTLMATPALSPKRKQAAAALLSRTLSTTKRPGFVLAKITNPTPFAVAVPTRPPHIVMTDSIEKLLTPGQLQAVLAHEFAHLHQRHAIILRITDAFSSMLPLVPGMKRLRQTMGLLTELAADDAAARQAGPAELANALATLARATDNESLHLRAERLTTKTWPRAHWRTIPESIRVDHF